ncbi:hypothetical protein DFH05DRAFT_1304220 [Lentinula detonsa]|uniref:Uncharacterized protein n=1 Tax=Lentinula detonsa TaxID=2804962 RepID=A0A9W8NYC1_9AGAR|nr:hypothetical protein DFH05DRAFT_1304220 [Lentinula detonsa]
MLAGKAPTWRTSKRNRSRKFKTTTWQRKLERANLLCTVVSLTILHGVSYSLGQLSVLKKCIAAFLSIYFLRTFIVLFTYFSRPFSCTFNLLLRTFL